MGSHIVSSSERQVRVIQVDFIVRTYVLHGCTLRLGPLVSLNDLRNVFILVSHQPWWCFNSYPSHALFDCVFLLLGQRLCLNLRFSKIAELVVFLADFVVVHIR